MFLDRPPAKTKAHTVLTQNAAGARHAVAHLIEAGHRRIAFVGDDLRLYTARERLAGYRRALEAAGLDRDPTLVSVANGTSGTARQATLELLALPRDRRPTAIFTGNNRCTVGTLQALGRRRRRVALVGFDDFELADVLNISVVRTDPYRIGRVAAELAFARIDGERRPARRVVIPTELVVRGSGEVAA